MSESSETPKEGDEAAPAPRGPKGIVLIGALVVSLILGAAGGLFAIGPMVAKKSGYVVGAAAAHGDSASADSAGGEEGASAGGEHGAGAEGEGAATSNLHLIDNLVLNPAGSGGTRFLMLAAAVEFTDSKLIDEIKSRDAEARDVVLRVMGSKTVEQLTDMSGRDKLRAELADSLGTLFKKKKSIRRIYFPQFVIQ